MKPYKEVVMKELKRRSKEYKEINLKETAQFVGINRLSSFDCREIIDRFVKENPTYKPVKICTQSQLNNPATASLWETCVLTELEYDRIH